MPSDAVCKAGATFDDVLESLDAGRLNAIAKRTDLAYSPRTAAKLCEQAKSFPSALPQGE